jgi:hypothetical protein
MPLYRSHIRNDQYAGQKRGAVTWRQLALETSHRMVQVFLHSPLWVTKDEATMKMLLSINLCLDGKGQERMCI